MIGNLLGPEIKELIASRSFSALREFFVEMDPTDVSDCINDLPEEDQAIVFRLLPQAQAIEVFEHLGADEQQRVLQAMGNEDAARILNEMAVDDRTALLEELPPAAVTQMLTLLSPSQREIARTILGYPEESVGRLLTPDFISVREKWTITQVLDHIRANGKDSETLNVLYVCDEKGRLIDDIHIREVLLSPPDRLVDDIHDNRFIAVRATDTQQDALDIFKKYERQVLPVVDSEDRLLGIVTIDDMLFVQEEIATEEVQKIGGMEALHEPYIDVPLRELVKKRAGWLVVLFLGEMLTTGAMGFFEHELEKAVILSVFIPLIISSGGNSGSQASTLVIRSLALGEVQLRDWWRVFRRELASGLLLGLTLSVVGFFRILLAGKYFDAYGPHYFPLAMAVSVAIIGVVLWGTISGSMLPFILRRFGLDPATSSTPFVATLVDVTGLLIYFAACMAFLKGTIL